MIHNLKSINPHFQDVKKGVKTFEYRNDDRPFKVGDMLILSEYTPMPLIGSGEYSGDAVRVLVTSIVRGTSCPAPILKGYCIMSTRLCE